MINDAIKNKQTKLEKILFGIEKIGNKIPDPMMLFVYLSIITIIASAVLTYFDWSAINPVTKKIVKVYNLATVDGLLKMLTSAISNFVTMPALGMVLTCMLGVGVANESGLFLVGLRGMVERSKGSDLKIIVIFTIACVLSHITGGTGFVVMPPLGALIFTAMGRNPLAGMMCAYASVTGAFACNVVVTSMDVITVSFTEAAAKMVIPDISLSPAIGYYYSLATVIPVTIAAVLITTHVVEPRLGKYMGKGIDDGERSGKSISELDFKALKYALWSMAIFAGVICAGIIPEHGILKDAATGSALTGKAPLMTSLAFIIALMFFIPGVVFGKVSGKFKDCRDVAKAMGKAMADMGTYIAIIFVIAQFLKYFDWSNLGIIIAIKGAELLQNSGFPISIVVVLFVLMCSFLNLFIGSASTKWAILSAVFVPMFMFLGYHPALPQMAYLIGDAVTNPICPTDAYFSMLLVLAQKYDPEVGIGTLLANMTPYAIAYLIIMTAILMIWFFLGLPLGPGAPLHI